MFTEYGYTTIAIVAVIVFAMFAAAVIVNNTILQVILGISGVLLLVFTLNFFRDPDRIIPNADNILVSPADGKVIVIKKVKEEKFINGEAWQISIFMSPLDVHVNRIPISGKVDYLNYHEGKYLVANHEKASEENERSEIGITTKFGKILFTQVAGYVARRIINELKQGEIVVTGERFGMIKFGSRVDIYVPLNFNIKVKNGDRTTAGETILVEIEK